MMSNRMLLIVILVVLLVFALPAWPYSRRWRFYPSSILAVILIILLILLLMGRL